MNSNILASIVFILFGSATLLVLPEQVQVMETSKFNAQTFPMLVTAGMIMSSVYMLVTELYQIVRKQSRDCIVFEWHLELNVLVYILLLILFSLAIPLVGFSIAGFAFSMASLAFFGCRRPFYYVLIVALSLLIHFVFSELLMVQLP